MKIKIMLLGCFVVLLNACSTETKPIINDVNNNAITSVAVPDYLDQNWDHKTRMEWWYTSQGSRLIPYDWFLALEKPNIEEKLSSPANLAQYRFIAWPADSIWNPDGLPIGFVADKDINGTRYLGFTCAACHTGKIAYKGKEYIVEGAPAHHDFDRFTTEVATSVQKTLADSTKFGRFVSNVLGSTANQEAIAELKNALSKQDQKFQQRVTMNHPPYPNGYARLDAFSNIFNEVVVNAINEPSNGDPANAPVSYPVLWDTPQHDLVQWSGSGFNAGIGPYARNVGEVVGVYGDLRIEKDPLLGMRFNNHININNLARLETILTTLWSPLWPEQTLPAIDQTKAQRGKLVYEQNCISCHQPIKRDDPARKITAVMTPVADIATDPTVALNIATRKSKTGLLDGQPIFPISKLEIINKLLKIPTFSAEYQSVQMVLYGVVGIIRAGLDPITQIEGLKSFVDAIKKNSFKANCDPDKKGIEACALPPRYKARPLNGIWASAPFLHNGSVANLWELLQKAEQRSPTFSVGSWEIDPVNVGFSTMPTSDTSIFDTRLPGNSNKGHEYGVNVSDQEKWELIEYIKTL